MNLNTLRKVCSSDSHSQCNSEQEMISSQEKRSSPDCSNKIRRFSLPPRIELTNAEPLKLRRVVSTPKASQSKGSKKLELLARVTMRQSLSSPIEVGASMHQNNMQEVIAK